MRPSRLQSAFARSIPFCLGTAWLGALPRLFAAVIPIQEPEPSKMVDFAKDVFPFLSENCVSCHSKTTRKGGLNLESPASMLKGGDSGEVLIAGNSAQSTLMKSATHADADSAMPPRDNKVKAKNLTPIQLGLLKRWIDQGAKGESSLVQNLNWKPLPPHLRSILAVTVSADGALSACSRGNQIFIYQTATGKLLFQTEAHRDLVQSLAFSPDASLLVSGGFREMKVWKHEASTPKAAVQLPQGLSTCSDDGTWSASVSESGFSIRNLTTPESHALVVPFADPIEQLSWSADASLLAVLGNQKRILIWSREESREIATIAIPVQAKRIVWLQNSSAVATAGGDSVIREWNPQNGALLRELHWHSTEVSAIANRNAWLVSSSNDGAICAGELAAAEPKLKFKSPAPSTSVDISGDGSKIAAAGVDKIARIFDQSGKLLSSAKGAPDAQIALENAQRKLELEDTGLTYAKEQLADAEKSAQTSKDRSKKAKDLLPTREKESDSKTKAMEDAKAQLALAKIKYDEAERSLQSFKASQPNPTATAVEGGSVQTQPVATSTETPEKKEAALTVTRKAAQDALDAAQKKNDTARDELQKAAKAKELAELELNLSASDEKLAIEAASKTKQELLRIEKLRADALAQVERSQKSFDDAPAITSIKFAEDHDAVLIGHASGIAQMRGTLSGLLIKTIAPQASPSSNIHSLFSTADSIGAVGSDGKVWRWNPSQKWVSLKTIGDGKSPKLFQDRLLAIAFSSDGKQLAVGTGDPSRDGDVLIWKTHELDAEPKKIEAIHSDTVLSLSFSPDGTLLVSGGADKTARIINIETLKSVRSLEGHTHHVLSVGWSPDSRTIVTGGADNSIKIWDVATGTRKKNVDGAEKEVTSVQFLSGGSQFIAASGDGKIRVIGINGTVSKTLSENGSFVNAIASPLNGLSLIAGGDDGALRLWNPRLANKIADFAPPPNPASQ